MFSLLPASCDFRGNRNVIGSSKFESTSSNDFIESIVTVPRSRQTAVTKFDPP